MSSSQATDMPSLFVSFLFSFFLGQPFTSMTFLGGIQIPYFEACLMKQNQKIEENDLPFLFLSLLQKIISQTPNLLLTVVTQEQFYIPVPIFFFF